MIDIEKEVQWILERTKEIGHEPWPKQLIQLCESIRDEERTEGKVESDKLRMIIKELSAILQKPEIRELLVTPMEMDIGI